MLTISLDEAGIFDAGQKKNSFDSDTTLIGGIIFDDLDIPGEEGRERQRIELYYRAVMQSIADDGGSNVPVFPRDLHYSTRENAYSLSLVKEKIRTTLDEFLDKGTLDGEELGSEDSHMKPRAGKYNICAIVKSKEGKSALLRSDLGKFFRDGIASNIYFHMASEAVEHFVFHNPVYPGASVFTMDIATRSSADIPDEHVPEYTAQGMINKSGKNFYYLMTPDVFRTILSEQMMSSDHKNIEIASFNVDRISYKDSDYDLGQVFFFLADSVCSVLTRDIGRDDIKAVAKRADHLLPGAKNLVFAYDEIDEFFKRAWRYVENGEYYEALKETYQITIRRSKEADLYNQRWVSYIKDMITAKIVDEENINDMSSVAFREVQKLKNSFMTNVLDQEEAFYILEVFKDALDKRPQNSVLDKLKYYISDICLRAYCHRGDPANALKYMDNCNKLATSVDIEEYARTRNQYATALYDSFDFSEAVNVLKDTLDLMEGLSKVSRPIVSDKNGNSFGAGEYAKTLSLAGQCAAFMGDGEAADIYFEMALELMAADVINRKITESYWLHYLIDFGDRDRFMTGMIEYSNGFRSAELQLKAISKMAEEREVNLRYALYLFIKGLYVFYEKIQLMEVWDDLKRLEADIPIKGKRGHPWELIYKYYCLIAIKLEDKKAVESYFNLIDDSTKEDRDTLINAIALSSKACIYSVKGNSVLEKQAYGEMYDLLRERFDLYNNAGAGSFKEKQDIIKGSFRYMYD